MSAHVKPTILVIVGITGDLSKRKLLPAIEKIVSAGVAPDKFKIIGLTRQAVTTQALLADSAVNPTDCFLADNLQMHQMGLEHVADYKHLEEHIAEIEKDFGEPAQCLFYLSVPPQISGPIINLLGESGLASRPHTKLLLEKPFGTDLESAETLIKRTKKYFKEAQIYRIDHYLAKAMAQNIIVFREGNALFKRTWNKEFIDSIEIIASESIGIEGRAGFYEQTGALRDLVQSHLLQLTALTLMETPAAGHLAEVPARRLQALKQLRTPAGASVSDYARRGQYASYTDEVKNPGSSVETYADVTLESTDPNWQGVPIRIVTGKSLAEKLTAIKIIYKRDREYESNELLIRLQPDEGFSMRIWTKVPGYEKRVEQHNLMHSLNHHTGPLPEAYEQVFYDAIVSDHTLFASSDEVFETWRILKPIQDDWAMNGELVSYEKGSDINLQVTKNPED